MIVTGLDKDFQLQLAPQDALAHRNCRLFGDGPYKTWGAATVR